MDYKEFLDYVKEHIIEYLLEREDLEIGIEQVKKNNGICLDSLIIKEEGTSFCPSIYLQNYYKMLQSGKELRDILMQIANDWREQVIPTEFENQLLEDYEQCQERLFLRLVNVGLNSEFWENTPYEPWHDLALTVRRLLRQDENGLTSILVTEYELDKWGVTWEQVYYTAKENTPKLFPAEIMPVQEILGEDTEGVMPFYILTNQMGINGATCLCYPNVVSDFAQYLNCNLYLLPSSIHEILILPDQGIYEQEQLFEMVWNANQSVVARGELLSYQIYYCDYKTGIITEVLTKYS